MINKKYDKKSIHNMTSSDYVHVYFFTIIFKYMYSLIENINIVSMNVFLPVKYIWEKLFELYVVMLHVQYSKMQYSDSATSYS